MTCIPQQSHPPLHEAHSQLSPGVPTVKHPMTPNTFPGTPEAFCHHFQQTPVHTHSLCTALLNMKHAPFLTNSTLK